MANQSFYDKKDIPQFQEEVCKKTCIMNGRCIDEYRDPHWFLMCPHYHSWKLGYGSFVWDQMQYDREHPEEVTKKVEKNKEIAKKLTAEKRAAKKQAKEKESK